MTVKPKTRKAPVTGTGINPKMTALASKIDKAHARASRMEEAREKGADDRDEANPAISKAHDNIGKLEVKLVEMAAANLEEMKLKARYVVSFRAHWPGSLRALWLAESIVKDLLALGGRPASPAARTKRKGK